jgi:sialate O-acetylesterase
MKKLFLFLVIFNMGFLNAQLRLPALLADNMVLQQNKVNRIWGWADPGQLVQVDFLEKNYPAYADANGNWSVFLDAAAAGKTGSMRVWAGEKEFEFKNIAIGEVWVCSGQSNMEWRMDMLKETYPQELKTARNDNIRFMVVEKTLATSPQKDLPVSTKWTAVTPETVGACSAVAYWYAKQLQKELKVPIGLIVTAWGGTPAQSWTSFEGLHDFSTYRQNFIDKIHPLKLEDMSRKLQEGREAFRHTLEAKAEYMKQLVQPGFDDSQWKEMYLPKPWEAQGFPGLDGIVTYRLTFNVNAADAGKAAELDMPAIDDIDSTYINGTFIGTTRQWDALRKYKIPAGVLKEGKNILVIKVQDDQGGGGLSDGAVKFAVTTGTGTIELKGNARYDIIAVLPDLTGGFGALEHQPAVLYNAMIAPLLPLSIQGAIWYQGESNADNKADAIEYKKLFPAMIRDWRQRWGQGEFPFLFVQLASFGAVQPQPADANWGYLREAQSSTLSLPNTGMAVATDIGNPMNIHPVQKQEVGDRLAAEAMRVVYGKPALPSTGPQFSSFKIKGNQVILDFKNTGKGLLAKAGPLKQFAVAGADKKFYWAEAIIVGRQIIVTCKQVPNPVAVRYAWANSPVDANLYNKEGFPASPFRTDRWE